MYNKINHRSRPVSSSPLFDTYLDPKLSIEREGLLFFIILILLSLAKSSSDACKWKFHHYSPSLWEMYWYNNITTLQNSVCSTLMQPDQMNKSVSTLEYIINLQKTVFHQSSTSNEYDALLSKIYYQYECAGSSQSKLLVSQYIEPLIGLLRDPLTICFHNNIPPTLQIDMENALHSKRFFLLGPSAPYQNFQTSTPSIAPWLYRPGSQKILFDLGSAYFYGVDSKLKSSPVVGMRWFYEYFRLNSLQFDRIIAFESAECSSLIYWDQIPDDIIGKLTFINRGINKTGKFNPWNILKSIAKDDDYVIIKLDIDQPMLENDLVNQVINDTSISSLIDEMCFEMHVRVNEMLTYWGTQPGELKDSYILFTKLRQLGIRMHSWP